MLEHIRGIDKVELTCFEVFGKTLDIAGLVDDPLSIGHRGPVVVGADHPGGVAREQLGLEPVACPKLQHRGEGLRRKAAEDALELARPHGVEVGCPVGPQSHSESLYALRSFWILLADVMSPWQEPSFLALLSVCMWVDDSAGQVSVPKGIHASRPRTIQLAPELSRPFAGGDPSRKGQTRREAGAQSHGSGMGPDSRVTDGGEAKLASGKAAVFRMRGTAFVHSH